MTTGRPTVVGRWRRGQDDVGGRGILAAAGAVVVDRRGAVAIETGLAATALLVLAVFILDVVRLIETMSRMDRVAAVTADLVARNDDVVDSTDFRNVAANNALGAFFFAANEIARPDDLVNDGRVIVSSILPKAAGFDLNWQRTGPYTLTASSQIGDLGDLPTTGNFIVSEVFFQFRPLVLDQLDLLDGFSTLLYARALYRPRMGALTSLQPPV
ncbi:MAG: hypothetical protein AAFX81_16390 [Pseudomonadota bacterium]